MKLGRQFRRPDWRRMLSEISSVEYIEWCRHFGRFPMDYEIGQFAMGQICATLMLPHCSKGNAPSVSDFYFNRPERAVQTDADIQAVAASIPGLESFA